MPISLTGRNFEAASTQTLRIRKQVGINTNLRLTSMAQRLNYLKTLMNNHAIDPRFVILHAVRLNDPALAIALIDFVEIQGLILPLEQVVDDTFSDENTNFFAYIASHGYVKVTERLYRHGIDNCVTRYKRDNHVLTKISDEEIRTLFAKRVLEDRCIDNKTLPEYLMSVVSPYTLINEGIFATKNDKQVVLDMFNVDHTINEQIILQKHSTLPVSNVIYTGMTATLEFIFDKMIEADVSLNKCSAKINQIPLLDVATEFYVGTNNNTKKNFARWLLVHHIRNANDFMLTGESRLKDSNYVGLYHFELKLTSLIRGAKQIQVNASFEPLGMGHVFNNAVKKQNALRAEKHANHHAVQTANHALNTASAAYSSAEEANTKVELVEARVTSVELEVVEVKLEVKQVKQKVKAIEVRVDNLEESLKDVHKFVKAQCQKSDVATITLLKDRDVVAFYRDVRDAIEKALRETLDGVLKQTDLILAAKVTAGALELSSNVVGAPGAGLAAKLLVCAANHIGMVNAKSKSKLLKSVLQAYDAPKLIAMDVAESLAFQLKNDPETLHIFKNNKDKVIAAVIRVIVKKQLGKELKHLVAELNNAEHTNHSELLTSFSSFLKLTAADENPHTRETGGYNGKHKTSSSFKGFHCLFKPEICVVPYLNNSSDSSYLGDSDSNPSAGKLSPTFTTSW